MPTMTLRRFSQAVVALVFAIHSQSVLPIQSADSNYAGLIEQANVSYPLQTANGELLLPPVDTATTALLEVTVDSTLSGALWQPRLRVGTLEFAFPRRVSGRHYLNISALMGTKEQKFALHEEFLRLDARLTLHLFANRVLENSRSLLVISPHPDDAELAAFGLYSQHRKSFVVTITRGQASQHNRNVMRRISNDVSDAAFSDTLAALRVSNSLAVPLIGRVPICNSRNLAYADNGLGELYARRASPDVNRSSDLEEQAIQTRYRASNSCAAPFADASNEWAALVADLRLILRLHKPDTIVTPSPILDINNDHQLATLALFEAIRAEQLRDGNLLFYSNHWPAGETFPLGRQGSPLSPGPPPPEAINFSSLLSLELDAETYARKFAALDAMHDLRETSAAHSGLEIMGIGFRKLIKRLVPGYDRSLLRRALRRNELFFVAPISDLYDPGKAALMIGREYSESGIFAAHNNAIDSIGPDRQ